MKVVPCDTLSKEGWIIFDYVTYCDDDLHTSYSSYDNYLLQIYVYIEGKSLGYFNLITR